MSKIALAVLLGVAPAFVSAQTIYKCTSANGAVTYSQAPCGRDAKLVMDSKPSVKRGDSVDDAAQSATPKTAPRSDPNIQAISDSVEDSNCRRAAQRSYIEPDTSEIDGLMAQVRSLENSHYVGATTGVYNANSQHMEQEDRIRASNLRGVIATKEQQNASIRADSQRAMRDALAECDRKKSEREKATTY